MSAMWEAETRGHLTPEAERAQLKVEINQRMERVEKLIANENMAADKKIAAIDGLKTEINERKTRIVQLKAEARAAAAKEPAAEVPAAAEAPAAAAPVASPAKELASIPKKEFESAERPKQSAITSKGKLRHK